MVVELFAWLEEALPARRAEIPLELLGLETFTTGVLYLVRTLGGCSTPRNAHTTG